MLKKILIIEDDRESNDYLALFLRKRYEQVFSAYDGFEGWQLYEKHSPDLILSDIEMPKMNGLKLIERIRQKDKTTRIVILSAYSHPQYLLKAVSMQLEEYILKPITFNAIDSLLNRIEEEEEEEEEERKNYLYLLDKMSETYYHYGSKSVLISHQRISLANLEIAMIELLIENRGEVICYSDIGESLYGKTLDNHNALKCLIKNLRSKIPNISIRSIPKVGYILS